MLGGPEFGRRLALLVEAELQSRRANLKLAKSYEDFKERCGFITALECVQTVGHEIVQKMEDGS